MPQIEPMTHEEAVARIVDAIVNPPPPMHVSAAHIARVRQALFAVTAPAKLLEELSGDLTAIRKATATAGTVAAADHVPLEEQVAAWQAALLGVQQDKARIERELRTVGEFFFREILAANDIEASDNGEDVARKHDRFWSAFRTAAQFFERYVGDDHGADYTFDEMYCVTQAEG